MRGTEEIEQQGREYDPRCFFLQKAASQSW